MCVLYAISAYKVPKLTVSEIVFFHVHSGCEIVMCVFIMCYLTPDENGVISTEIFGWLILRVNDLVDCGHVSNVHAFFLSPYFPPILLYF